MKIWTNEADFDLQASAAALGMFDGVHIGHQTLIHRARSLADELHAACVVCTFDRHPISVLCPERAPRQLTTIEEKLHRFEKLGVDGVLLTPFTREFAQTDPLEYLEKLVKALRIRALVAGFNYSFGAGGKGNAELIRAHADRLGYRAEIIEPVREHDQIVSSTRIRGLVASGDIAYARRLLAMDGGANNE